MRAHKVPATYYAGWKMSRHDNSLFETDAHNHFENIVMEECKDIIEYNYFLINRDLVALKKKLYRYKTYIYSGSLKVS